MKFQTVNPATEDVLESYKHLSAKQIDKKIAEVTKAQQEWKSTSFKHRKKLMLSLAAVLRKKNNKAATLISQEMGKPITAAQAEIEKCAWVCEHYAQQAETYLASRFIQTEMKMAKVSYQPLGIVFAIMPWNFPFWQVFRAAVPSLMAGNAFILKHAAITTGCGALIERLMVEAGFPSHLFTQFILDSKGAKNVIAHQDISAVTLTGSGKAGSEVASQAGKFLKKSVLELGGNDPYVVLDDADLELAAQCIVDSRLSNSGQVCIAAKRIIVVKSQEKALISKIKANMKRFKMGDPLDAKTNLGPLARNDLRETLQQQIENSIEQGAKLIAGGIMPSSTGFYYPPTLLTNVEPGMPAFDEELFGPVISVITAKSEEHAIVLANQSQYGLGAAIFTRDLKKGEKIATEDLHAGVCFINSLVASDPRLPFGGIKNSGYGRELSKEGILEFVNVKTIAINDN